MFKKIRLLILVLMLGIMPVIKAVTTEQDIVNVVINSPGIDGVVAVAILVPIGILIQLIRARFAPGSGSAVDPLTPNQTTIEPQDTELISYAEGLRSAILAAREAAGNPTDTSDVDSQTFEDYTSQYLVGQSSQTTIEQFKQYILTQYPTEEGYTTYLSRVIGDPTKNLPGFGGILSEFDELVLPKSYKGGLLDYVIENNMSVYDMNNLYAWINNVPNLEGVNYQTLTGNKYIQDFVMQSDTADSSALKAFVESIRKTSASQTNYESINTINDMLTQMSKYTLPEMPSQVAYKGNLDFLIRNNITTPEMFEQLQKQVETGGLLPVQYEPLTGPEGAYNTALASLKNNIALDTKGVIVEGLPDMIDNYQSFLNAPNVPVEQIAAYTANMQAAITQYSSTPTYSGISYNSMDNYMQMLNGLQISLPKSTTMKSILDNLNSTLTIGGLTPDTVLTAIQSSSDFISQLPAYLAGADSIDVLKYKLTSLSNYALQNPGAVTADANLAQLSSDVIQYQVSMISTLEQPQPINEGASINPELASAYQFNGVQVKSTMQNITSLVSKGKVLDLLQLRANIEELEENAQGAAQTEQVEQLKAEFNEARNQLTDEAKAQVPEI